MQVKIKRLREDAVIPQYAKAGDAGLDLVAVDKTPNEDNLYIEYGTGLAIEIPYGYVGLVFPRSSMSDKSQILANSVGVIDSGYRGELKIRMKIDGNAAVYVTSDDPENDFPNWKPSVYQVGDKVAQLIILPYPQIEFKVVEELSESKRGDSGFGSSDGIQATLDYEV